MSARVCAVGEFTSKLAAVYLEHLASGSVEDVDSGTGKEEIQLLEAFRELQLPVSVNQANQILLATQRHRPTVAAESHRKSPPPTLSWGEFCVFSIELQSLLARAPQEAFADPKGHRSPHTKRGRSLSQHGCKYEVFLGGSCNPTTWRRDVAIPSLQKEGITYYNPQVEEWFPELIEIEEQAKQAANMPFFVVDNQTRAVSSMVEIAYLTGSGRDLVLVVADFQRENPKVGEDILPKREVEDLIRGRVFVRKLAEEGGSLFQSSVEEAVRSAITIIQSSQSIAEYSARHTPIRLMSSHSLGEELRLLRQVFTMYDSNRSGHLSIQEAELALRSLHLEGSIISHLAATESYDHLSSWQQHGILFDDFCTLYAELKYRKLLEVWGGWVGKTLSYIGASWRWLSFWLWPFPPPHLSSSSPPLPFRDVFLGGSCGSTFWRTDTVIPILRQYGVSYFNPQVHNWDARLIPIEKQAKEQCSVLLFVVSGDTLSVASMVEVAYYIGQGRKLVLLLNDISLSEDQEVEGMKLSLRARQDYNRGRAYLANIANISRIPVYTNITDAALSTVYMVKGYRVPPISALPLSGTSV